jgi:ribosome assembly protein YihI (activator of Der GTPase)
MRGEKDEVEERGAVAEELTAEARRSRKNFYHRGHRGTQRKIGTSGNLDIETPENETFG